MNGPVEDKVKRATAASAMASVVLWALGAYMFRDAVPEPVAAAVMLIVPAGLTFLAGWVAPHTPRPDLTDQKPPEN